MEVRASSKYVRMSDKKVRDITRVIAGKNAEEALQFLKFIPKKSARFVAKTLASAIANAFCKGVNTEVLVIKEVIAEQGIALKRSVPASRGSAHPIRKRTSHIKIILTDNLK
ncbi:MAG: 50S ribosomal protein L22 [Puniceicoccales bacterium]|jgi:large subunit ribosomal protein L22|nr:50S ribosomal protein L22 [Puniceicoccales bacterium]